MLADLLDMDSIGHGILICATVVQSVSDCVITFCPSGLVGRRKMGIGHTQSRQGAPNMTQSCPAASEHYFAYHSQCHVHNK